MNPVLFEKHVSRTEFGCWLWTGSKTGNGYGKCQHNRRTLGAHVVSYMMFKGAVPEGLIVRHTCDVKHCVNPAHLVLGTYSDNLNDQRERGRIGRLPNVSEETVNSIFFKRLAGNSNNEIAEEFDLDRDYVRNLCAGVIQPHLKKLFEDEWGPLPYVNSIIKYSDEDIEDMKTMKAAGFTTGQIGKKYKTTYKYIWKILSGNIRTKPLLRRGDV